MLLRRRKLCSEQLLRLAGSERRLSSPVRGLLRLRLSRVALSLSPPPRNLGVVSRALGARLCLLRRRRRRALGLQLPPEPLHLLLKPVALEPRPLLAPVRRLPLMELVVHARPRTVALRDRPLEVLRAH